jgi:hypothetical protein
MHSIRDTNQWYSKAHGLVATGFDGVDDDGFYLLSTPIAAFSSLLSTLSFIIDANKYCLFVRADHWSLSRCRGSSQRWDGVSDSFVCFRM